MESNSIPLFSYAMRFGLVLFGLVRLEYLNFGIRYFGILPASVHHCILHKRLFFPLSIVNVKICTQKKMTMPCNAS